MMGLTYWAGWTGVLWSGGTAAHNADLYFGGCRDLTGHHVGGCGGYHGGWGYPGV